MARDLAKLIKWECENGYAGRKMPSLSFIYKRRDMKLEPRLADVLHGLILDSSVLNYSSFEDWAADMGGDKDSRQAEATYRACLDIGLKFRNGLGEAAMTELSEACQEL